MTNGQRAVMRLRRYLGVTETPWASNRGPGFIDRCQEQANIEHAGGRPIYTGQPWCAMAVEQALREESIDDRDLLHPYTGDLGVGIWWRCRNFGLAKMQPPRPYPPGCLIIKPGIHVELLVADLGDGTVAGIGGNVNNAVTQTRRDVGEWTILAPPWVLEGEPEPVTIFWFEVPALMPARFGGWPTKGQREGHIAKHVPPSQLDRVRRVRQAPPRQPYAYEIVPVQPPYGYLVRPGVSRDWLEKANRDRAAAAFTKATGLPVRIRSRREHPSELAVELENLVTGGSTT